MPLVNVKKSDYHHLVRFEIWSTALFKLLRRKSFGVSSVLEHPLLLFKTLGARLRLILAFFQCSIWSRLSLEGLVGKGSGLSVL